MWCVSNLLGFLWSIPCCWNVLSRHLSMSPDKWEIGTKPRFGYMAVCFQEPVYFGQQGLLETLTTAHNCFITLRFVLIGSSKVAYFARCQSLACVAVQCTHSSTAEWRWIEEGGVNDLTEDSVELTPATEQTICSFHQQLWSKKKEKERDKERTGRDEL